MQLPLSNLEPWGRHSTGCKHSWYLTGSLHCIPIDNILVLLHCSSPVPPPKTTPCPEEQNLSVTWQGQRAKEGEIHDENLESVFISGCQNGFNILLAVEFARQLIMLGWGRAVSIFKCRASIWNDYSQAEARQSMKYLACKAFQCARLGPDVGAVILKTTIPKSEVPQAPTWRPQRCSSCQGSVAMGLEVSLSWQDAGNLAGHRLVWEGTSIKAFPATQLCQIMLPLAALSQISVPEGICL